ncbi:unnamed protein product [Rhizophagus irregularis]|uniref:Serine-threonine/tyrosine-protein kinase catalytic domain-containing protein n=1 Tax=Rhizophagus irregularis TaxID=588596 RepID=A0A915ZTP8_9GLOM|nr:unnamed protein product [Rhizophagus irregularis]
MRLRCKGGFSKVYSATWKDGPLCYDLDKKEWIRQTNEIVALKCLFNSQNINDKFLNEVKAYSTSATGGRKPFDNCAHDENLALKICNGIRPEFNESEVPKCYIELMKRCWDSNPANRPSISEIKEVISLFEDSCSQQYEFQDESHYEIEKQFKEAEICRRLDYVQSTTHPQAIYKARELNSFTTGLSKNINNEVSDNDNNKVSDEMAVEDLFIQDVENNEFSDNIAVEELLLQHTMQNWQ